MLAELIKRLPAPPSAAVLDPLREEAAKALLESVQPERAAVATRLRFDPPAGRRALAAMAERLLAELRARTTAAAGPGVPAWLARADARFPTARRERMDREDVPDARRKRIHRDLHRLGQISGMYDRLCELLRPYASEGASPDRPLRVLDVGSGDGGFVLTLHRWAQREGLRLEITASDLQPSLVEEQKAAMTAAGMEPRAIPFDALNPDIPPRTYDVITCTHMLHHLPPGAVAVLYAEAARLAARGVLLVDLWRSPEFLVALPAAVAALTANPDLIHDAFVSVRRSLTPAELRLLTGCTYYKADVRVIPPGWLVAEHRRS